MVEIIETACLFPILYYVRFCISILYLLSIFSRYNDDFLLLFKSLEIEFQHQLFEDAEFV